jgi:hypothetical protein
VRDIIWTIIVIWLVWKIYDAFVGISKRKPQTQGVNNSQNNFRKEGEVKIERDIHQKSHFKPEDGEYVDYEEIK